MLFYAFIIIALQCTSCFGCTLRILYNFSSRTNEVVPIRCYYFQSVSQIAICLLQLNGIASLMKCSEDAPDKAHRWPVAPGGFYDNRDLVLRGNTYEGSVNQRIDPDDGAFTATPRAILVRAIESCVNHRGPHDYFCDSDLLATFAHCPYANFKDFMDCLCCLNVGQEDFEGLQTHIDLTDLGNKAYSPSSRYQWTCPNTMCNENGFLVKPRAKRVSAKAEINPIFSSFPCLNLRDCRALLIACPGNRSMKQILNYYYMGRSSAELTAQNRRGRSR